MTSAESAVSDLKLTCCQILFSDYSLDWTGLHLTSLYLTTVRVRVRVTRSLRVTH